MGFGTDHATVESFIEAICKLHTPVLLNKDPSSPSFLGLN